MASYDSAFLGYKILHGNDRAGGTGPAAPVLAGPIFEAPTIFF